MNLYSPEFYEVKTMSLSQAWLRGFYQGQTGRGPFGIWHSLEEDPTPHNAQLVAQWLNGWSKGRELFNLKNN